MNFFNKLSRGWDISLSTFRVLRENRQLILFPILSGVSMIALTASFVIAIFATARWDADLIAETSKPVLYAGAFLFYILSYFIVVFFNTALIHCSSLYFRGERPTIKAGLEFSRSRIGVILAWSLFAGTVGFLLRMLQENLGTAGRIITGLIGIVWNIATFFAVPVLIYENTNPIQTVKRSAQLMKNKWGETLGASFSFAIIRLLAMFLVCGILFILGWLINIVAGIVLAAIGLLAVIAVLNAMQTIFVSAVYNNVTGDPVKHFEQQFVDNLFIAK